MSNAKLPAVIERPVFIVAPPPGVRYPEIAEEGSDAAIHSFVLPAMQPAAG